MLIAKAGPMLSSTNNRKLARENLISLCQWPCILEKLAMYHNAKSKAGFK